MILSYIISYIPFLCVMIRSMGFNFPEPSGNLFDNGFCVKNSLIHVMQPLLRQYVGSLSRIIQPPGSHEKVVGNLYFGGKIVTNKHWTLQIGPRNLS